MSKKKKKNKKSAKGAAKVSTLKALAENALIADVVAAALVATASALKDSNRARALANDAGEELNKLSKAGAERGSALWDLALQIGRRSLETLTSDSGIPKSSKSRAAPRTLDSPKAKAKVGERKRATKKQRSASTKK